MTDEEKIEQIISRMENGYEFNPSSHEIQLLELDMNWLINYAKGTSKRIKELKINNETVRENSRRLRAQNKRYREAVAYVEKTDAENYSNMYELLEDIKFVTSKTLEESE